MISTCLGRLQTLLAQWVSDSKSIPDSVLRGLMSESTPVCFARQSGKLRHESSQVCVIKLQTAKMLHADKP